MWREIAHWSRTNGDLRSRQNTPHAPGQQYFLTRTPLQPISMTLHSQVLSQMAWCSYPSFAVLLAFVKTSYAKYTSMSDRLKRHIWAVGFDLTPIECWITLPAIWSEEAKDATLKAARNAGFGSWNDDEVYTIAEPEAAAIATLREYSEVDGVNAVKVSDTVNTSDLILIVNKLVSMC